jgi:hypothetical protein
MRLTDDFLLLTDSLPLLHSFAAVAHAGLPSYGCTINPSKTQSTVPLHVIGPDGTAVDIQPVDSQSVRLGGLLTNHKQLLAHYIRWR